MLPKRYFLFVSFIVLLSGCNTSTKGNWSESDKLQAKEWANDELEQYPDLTVRMKNAFIDCYVSELENRFNSLNEINESDITITTLLGMKCAKEVTANGSVKGDWSESDKQKMLVELKIGDDGSLLEDGIDPEKYFPFLIANFENDFSSYYDATRFENIDKLDELSEIYQNEFRLNGSKKGSWSTSDINKLLKEIEELEASIISEGVEPSSFSYCLTFKCQQKYHSYYHAMKDIKGLQQLMRSCILSN